MKLDELAALIANGETAATLLEALGQRMVSMPEGWDWEGRAAVCECECLLVPLPRPVRLERVIVIRGQAYAVTQDMTHAHLAGVDGRPVCAECVDDGPTERICANGDHQAEMCDTPNAVMCSNCADEAALPNLDHCPDCRPYEQEWDKDSYLGL
ncbi:hypothetical protein [Streptomyces sp. NPDC059278]|uniref:hypothetical protein n=1 Tax=Streptomyces sp. NPDC059278 TaxID=3346801 RepID=UPI00367ED1C4